MPPQWSPAGSRLRIIKTLCARLHLRSFSVAGLIFWLSITASVNCTHSTGPSLHPTPPPDTSLESLGRQFKTLRDMKGHFDGHGWNAVADRWMGPKHRLMQSIARLADQQRPDRSRLEQLLGPPDRITGPGRPLFKRLCPLPESGPIETDSDVMLIYKWRGLHDFLYFIYREHQMIGSGWWYAGE